MRLEKYLIEGKKTIKKGDKVRYIGKGFLGFDPKMTEMIILEIKPNDYWVNYNGNKMLVRNYEVEK